MSDYLTGRGRRADSRRGLRLAALTAVIVGVVLLAIAAFLLSYGGIHSIAHKAGVPATLATLYPLIFDAMLVIVSAAILALRGAGWVTRVYVWFSLLILVAGVAAGDALHAMKITLPQQPSRAAVAITPWVLLLLGFGLWLAMLRHARRVAATNSQTSGQVSPGGQAAPFAPGNTGRARRAGRQGHPGRQGRQPARAARAGGGRVTGTPADGGAGTATAAGAGPGGSVVWGSGTGTWTARPTAPPAAAGTEQRPAAEGSPAQRGHYGGGHYSGYAGDTEGSPGYQAQTPSAQAGSADADSLAEPELAEDDPAADHSAEPGDGQHAAGDPAAEAGAAPPGSAETTHFQRMRSSPTPPEDWGAEPK
jgi:Protein of unknown function (DUF2637)